MIGTYEDWVDMAHQMRSERNKALDENDRLTAELNERRKRVDAQAVFAGTQTDECARLRAENERLRGEYQTIVLRLHGEVRRCEAAESSLAAAEGLLDAALEAINQDAWTVLSDDIRAFLANQPSAPVCVNPRCAMQGRSDCPDIAQPAAPTLCVPGDICQRPARCLGGPCLGRAQPAAPTRTEAIDTSCMRRADLEDEVESLRDRAEAEQAVLDAMGAVPEDTLRRSLANTLHTDEHSRAPARAELARRELK